MKYDFMCNEGQRSNISYFSVIKLCVAVKRIYAVTISNNDNALFFLSCVIGLYIVSM